MALELLLLSVNLNFILISVYLDDILGQIFSLFILTIAAAESAIALALLVVFYRRKGSIDLNLLQHLKA
jgi:NADH-quinone oxidoreductase subunit K